MRKIRVLSVCGSGTVSSAMVAEKLKDALEAYGYRVEAVESNPGGVESACGSSKFDFIACASPVPGEFGIPKLNAIGFLTGMGEEEFIEEALKVIRAIED